MVTLARILSFGLRDCFKQEAVLAIALLPHVLTWLQAPKVCFMAASHMCVVLGFSASFRQQGDQQPCLA